MPRKVQASRLVSGLSVLPLFVFAAMAAHAQAFPDRVAPAGPHTRLAQSGELKGETEVDSASVRSAAPVDASAPRMVRTPRMVRLKRVRYVAPEYPPGALHEGVSGYVIIDFLVNGKGEPTALQVVDAKPTDIFNNAALDAVKRWRYEPPTATTTEVPTRATVRFELPVVQTVKKGT
jgi:periplasmic protein TonB